MNTNNKYDYQTENIIYSDIINYVQKHDTCINSHIQYEVSKANRVVAIDKIKN